MIIAAREMRKGDIVQRPTGSRVGEGPWHEVTHVKFNRATDTVTFKLKGLDKKFGVVGLHGMRRK